MIAGKVLATLLGLNSPPARESAIPQENSDPRKGAFHSQQKAPAKIRFHNVSGKAKGSPGRGLKSVFLLLNLLHEAPHFLHFPSHYLERILILESGLPASPLRIPGLSLRLDWFGGEKLHDH